MSAHDWLLRVLPRRFRLRHGAAMHDTFVARAAAARARGRGALLAVWLREALDVLVTAARLHAAGAPTLALGRSELGGGAFAALHLDVRLALRSLTRSWRFALAFVAPMAIAVGAGAGFYGIIDQVLYRPAPGVLAPDRLVRIAITVDGRDPFELGNTGAAWIDYEVLRSARQLDEVAAFTTVPSSLGRGEGARRIPVGYATWSFFPLTGVVPQVGRFFVTAEDQVSALAVPCVVSDRLWRSELGGVPTALGRVLTVGAVECTVIGVTPAGFNGLGYSPVDAWIPLRAAGAATFGDEALWNTDGSHWLRIVGRLADGASVPALAEEATAAYRSIGGRRRDPNLEETMVARPVVGLLSGGAQRLRIARWLVAGAATLVLLVSANLVNLLVARNLERAHDTGVRVALGARRWRLLRLHLIECVLLAAAAGVASLAVVAWAGALARAALFTGVEFADGPLTARVGLIAVAGSLLLATFVAVIATAYAGAIDPIKLLKAGGSSRISGTRRSRRVRLGLVAFQAALSVTLLLASAAFTRSFRQAVGSHLGFEIDGLILADVPRVSFEDGSDERHAEMMSRLHEQLRNTPGVRSASLGYTGPWRNNRTESVRVPGRDTLPEVPAYRDPLFDAVTPDYLATLGLTMRYGRWLEEGDGPGAPPVVVVNESLARLYWPGESSVLGRCMQIGETSAACREIVGVVADHRVTGGLDDAPTPGYFLPVAQAAEYRGDYRVFVRTDDDAEALLPVIRRLVQGADPEMPAAEVLPVQALLDPSLASWRVGAMAFTALGGVAGVVAAIGLFGVLAYMVAERRREFAIRGALGGGAARIVTPVLAQGMRVVTAGALVGGALAWAAARWLDPLLFHVELLDPAMVALVFAGVLAIGALASWVPARLAAQANPLELLKSE